MITKSYSKTKTIVASTLVSIWSAPVLAASSTTLPWESSLSTIVNSLTGPVAVLVSTAAVIITGFVVMFSEGGSMMRRAAGVGLGISIVAGATTILANVFGLATGATF